MPKSQKRWTQLDLCSIDTTEAQRLLDVAIAAGLKPKGTTLCDLLNENPSTNTEAPNASTKRPAK